MIAVLTDAGEVFVGSVCGRALVRHASLCWQSFAAKRAAALMHVSGTSYLRRENRA